MQLHNHFYFGFVFFFFFSFYFKFTDLFFLCCLFLFMSLTHCSLKPIQRSSDVQSSFWVTLVAAVPPSPSHSLPCSKHTLP